MKQLLERHGWTPKEAAIWAVGSAAAVVGVVALDHFYGDVTVLQIDRYSNDTSNVRCDGEPIKTKLLDGELASFTVHDKANKASTVTIKRVGKMIMAAETDAAEDSVTSLEDLQFSSPTAISLGPEFTLHSGSAVWTIDVDGFSELVAIRGSC